jgi:N-acyl-D-aspartate/D-glutamate deacylase
MTKFKRWLTGLLLMVVCLAAVHAADYPTVISNGRVIDPESGLDAIRHIGIRGGKIAAVSAEPLIGEQMIDASGQVVVPGFIDLHSHTPTQFGQWLNVQDGITTQLDLEAGAFPVLAYGDHFAGGARLNYGASVGHAFARWQVIEGDAMSYAFVGRRPGKMGGPAWLQPATAAQIEQIAALLQQGLDDGGLGIGLLLDYMTAAVSQAELAMVFDVAARNAVPVFVHVRRGSRGDPAGLVEVLAEAERSGAPLYVCHITHNAMGRIGEWLALIDAARARGVVVATETLTYGAGGTTISADVFTRRDWREMFAIDYSDVQWVATGEWLDEASWNRYQAEQPHGMVNHHYVKEAWLEQALAWPEMMVSTDALPAFDRDVLANPNIAGSFSRFLGHYVRERGLMSLSDAVARTSYLQARWMQQVSNEFAAKGRIQVGADADIVVFNPQQIGAAADYGVPYRPARGISAVLLGGRLLVDQHGVVEGRYGGRRLLGDGAR